MSGTTNDKTHWNTSTGPQELSDKYQNGGNGYQLAIGGDKAYKGVVRPKGWLNYVTMTALAEEEKEEVNGEKQEDDNKEYIADPGIARFRSTVERTIGAMKKWKILSNEALISQIDCDEMNQLIVFIAGLTNHQLKHNKTMKW